MKGFEKNLRFFSIRHSAKRRIEVKKIMESQLSRNNVSLPPQGLLISIQLEDLPPYGMIIFSPNCLEILGKKYHHEILYHFVENSANPNLFEKFTQFCVFSLN